MMTQVATGSQQQLQELVDGNAASAGGGGEPGAQMGYDGSYGLPSTSQPQAEQPTQPGYPPQPVTYDYSQWQGTQHSTGGEEEHRQQELDGHLVPPGEKGWSLWGQVTVMCLRRRLERRLRRAEGKMKARKVVVRVVKVTSSSVKARLVVGGASAL